MKKHPMEIMPLLRPRAVGIDVDSSSHYQEKGSQNGELLSRMNCYLRGS
ncbi:MAG: hypothetical protein AAGC64_11260 [Bacteroidota bacterium]